ncbi:hypothetical protein ACJX0J_012965, partial [Zea mays]
ITNMLLLMESPFRNVTVERNDAGEHNKGLPHDQIHMFFLLYTLMIENNMGWTNLYSIVWNLLELAHIMMTSKKCVFGEKLLWHYFRYIHTSGIEALLGKPNAALDATSLVQKMIIVRDYVIVVIELKEQVPKQENGVIGSEQALEKGNEIPRKRKKQDLETPNITNILSFMEDNVGTLMFLNNFLPFYLGILGNAKLCSFIINAMEIKLYTSILHLKLMYVSSFTTLLYIQALIIEFMHWSEK